MENLNVESLSTVQTGGSKKPSLPRAMVEYLSVVEKFSAKWHESGLPSLYAEPAVLSSLMETMTTKQAEKEELQNQRRIVAKQIRNLNKEIDQSLIFVKDALKRDFGKADYTSYMAKFGFSYSAGLRWYFPLGVSQRLHALENLISALAEYQPDVGKYDASFWQDKHDSLLGLSEQSHEYAGKISLAVTARNTARTKVRKIVQSVILLVKANYFDSYKAILRDWGIQKETF